MCISVILVSNIYIKVKIKQKTIIILLAYPVDLFSSLNKYNPDNDKRYTQVLPIVILLMEHEFTY